VAMLGSGCICIVLEEGRTKGVGQSDAMNDGERPGPIGSLQVGAGEVCEQRVRERRNRPRRTSS
jgi:hypothetical protein